MARSALLRLALAGAALAALGCDPDPCSHDETFVVEEMGTCAPAATRFTLTSQACHVFVNASPTTTGLPRRGAMSQSPRPLRQGDFILYGDEPSTMGFRLCRARRVEYRLELTCVDAQGTPICSAALTEPVP